MKDEKLKIYMIKTDNGCFVSSCKETEPVKMKYFHDEVGNLYFDGNKPQKSYLENWYYINQYPSIVERKEPDKNINKRYELSDWEMESKKIPLVINYNDMDIDDPIYDLYEYKYDIIPGKMIEIDYEIEVVMEIENFELPPTFEYKGFEKKYFGDAEIKISRANIEHPLFQKMFTPEVILHNNPCSISSDNLYKLVRKYIKDNIDPKYAEITSDYNFCFTVKKRVPDNNNQAVKYTVFEMTNESNKYKGYTIIQPISASNEKELKNKIDKFLEELINHINEPLIECKHCNGSGVVNKQEEFDINKR